MSGDRREHPWGLALAFALIVPPLIAVCYYTASSMTEGGSGVELQWEWERWAIPFVPAMAGPYLSLYPLLVLGIVISRGRRELWRVVAALLLGTLLCAVAFVLVPTRGWPSASADGNWSGVYDELHRLDGDNCSAPSLHVVLAGILWVHYVAIVRGRWRWAVHGWFVLLIASTLLTHQHHAPDVLSGGALAALCIVLCGVGRRRGQIRFWRRLRSRRKMSIAPGPNSQSAVMTPNEAPVQVPRSQ